MPKNEANFPTLRQLGALLLATAWAQAADFRGPDELIRREKFAEALQILRAADDANDIYSCNCDDSRHQHRSSARQARIADCLHKLGREAEARAELRALFDASVEPAYLVSGDAKILLIALETAVGYDEFESWLEMPPRSDLPQPIAWRERHSLKRVVSAKKAIEQSRFGEALALLDGIEVYHRFLAPRSLTWEQNAVISYLTRQDNALDHLLARLPHAASVSMSKGLIYCLGEMRGTRAVPTLLEALGIATNSSIREELIFALAKCGCRAVTPDLFNHRIGNLYHQRYIDELLRSLTGRSFGAISSATDAATTFSGWRTWIKQEFPAAQLVEGRP